MKVNLSRSQRMRAGYRTITYRAKRGIHQGKKPALARNTILQKSERVARTASFSICQLLRVVIFDSRDGVVGHGEGFFERLMQDGLLDAELYLAAD